MHPGRESRGLAPLLGHRAHSSRQHGEVGSIRDLGDELSRGPVVGELTLSSFTFEHPVEDPLLPVLRVQLCILALVG